VLRSDIEYLRAHAPSILFSKHIRGTQFVTRFLVPVNNGPMIVKRNRINSLIQSTSTY